MLPMSVHYTLVTKRTVDYFQLLMTLPFILGLFLYLMALYVSSSSHRAWPWYRPVLWVMGSMAAGLAVSGPVSEAAHADFAMHMVSHLLLGMLAPLCMVMAAPRTLILRVLPVPLARHLSRAMKLRYIQFIADPLVASLLNMGGLWLLYATFLYAAMHHFQWLYVLLHIHVFLAGYLFTASMIEIDPRPHRPRFIYRAVVLVIALAAHSILAKFLYAHPPPHVPAAQAKLGALIMYYGGDLIDLLLIIIFCWQWYKASRPRKGRIRAYDQARLRENG